MYNPTCLVLGDINIDFTISTAAYPPEGGRAHAQQSDFRLGGSGCLTAIALNLFGNPTRLSGNLGKDIFADFVLERINAANMDTGLIRQIKDQQTGFFMVVATPGDQHTMFGSRGANDLPLPETDIIKMLPTCKHLHISGYTLREEEQFLTVQRIFQQALANGLTTSLDPGVCTSAEAREKIFLLLDGLDYLLPNTEELAALAGNISLDGQIAAMFKQGCKAIALKMGSEGSRFFDKQQDICKPANREIQASDTTGAGDCFNAGFLHSLFNGRSAQEALQAGNQAALRMLTSPRGILDWIE